MTGIFILQRGQRSTCKPIQASMVLFGVPKCFKYIWLSYVRNLIQKNPHVGFSIDLHMYHDLLVVNTPRNAERASVDSPKNMHEIITRSLAFEDSPIPVNIITSNQTAFDQTLLSWLDKSETLFDYDIHTTMNIFRQGISMKNTFFSASGLRAGENLVMSNGVQRCGCGNSTVYLFLRSDTLLLSPIIIPNVGLQSNSIVIPTWQAWRGVAYNDRLAMAGSSAAAIYTEAKSIGFNFKIKTMILDQKSKNSSLYLLGTPERMLKAWLDKQGDELNTMLLDDWAKLLRIRANNGAINGREKSEFGVSLNYVQRPESIICMDSSIAKM